MNKSLLRWVATAVLAGCLAGCVPPGKLKPGSDPLVVNAEHLAREATDTLDDFIRFVDRNWAVAGSDLKAARELAATSGPVYLRELRAATKTYKASRNAADGATVQMKIDALQSLLEMIREHYTPKGANV